MTDFYKTIEDILYRNHRKSIRKGTEPELIERARDSDTDAISDLLLGYANLIRKITGYYREVLSAEDLQEGVLLAAGEAIATSDGQTLSGKFPMALRASLQGMAGQHNHWEVKKRTLERYFGIMNEAQGELHQALRLCKSKHMLPETLMKIHQAVSRAESIEQPDGTITLVVTTDEPIDEDMEELLEACWQAVDNEETAVLEGIYGFNNYNEQQTPEAVSFVLGMPPRKVRRLRKTGLNKMRDAIGLTNFEEEDHD